MYQTLPDLSPYFGHSHPNRMMRSAGAARRPLNRLESRQDLWAVLCWANPLKHPADAAGLVDHKGCPEHTLEGPAHELFLPPNAIHRAHAVPDISQEGKWQAILRLELGVRSNSIRAYAQQRDAGEPVCSIVVAKGAGLFGAAGGVVSRVEVQHDGATSVIREPMLGSRLVLEFKIRSHQSRTNRNRRSLRRAGGCGRFPRLRSGSAANRRPILVHGLQYPEASQILLQCVQGRWLDDHPIRSPPERFFSRLV